MKIESREITYRQVVEQIFFEDGTELVVRTGWAEGQEADLDIEYEWIDEKPEWADEWVIDVD
jgi:hypothetical protein